MKFTELGLNPKVLEAIEQAGYETPTAIQAEAIPPALAGRDVLGIAQTGTGKTASFTLPMLTLLAKGRARARMPRSLILAPTRELAAQVSENFETYGAKLSLSKALLIGGVSFAEQDRIIDRGVDVLIATPGRLLDHVERGKLMLTGIEILVIDEADRMMDMGFIDDIERIFKLTPFTRQTLFFSATMPPEITRLTDEFLSNPVRVEVARQSTTAETVEQRLCRLPGGGKRERIESEKRRALRKLIDNEGDGLVNAIIFCNRKRDVAMLFKSLTSHGYDAGALHGDLDQRVRMQVLDGFKNGHVKLLVASDVAARGLDIPRVSHVFNFDVPIHAEDYVHRIGRTGRAGRSGIAITIAAPSDAKALAKVEELIGREVPRIELSGVTDRVFDEDEDEPRRERTRERDDKRGRGRREEGRREEERREEGRREESRREDGRREEPRRDDARRDEGRREDSRRDRDGRRRGGRRREERDEPVIGMGDHVPAFILREVPLPSRRKREEEAEDVEAIETAQEDAAAPVETIAAPLAESAAEISEEAQPEPAADAEAAPETAEEAPKKPRRRRTAKSKSAAEDGAEEAGQENGQEAAEETPKPRRRRRKAADAAETESESAASDDAAEKPKRPRRTRKKKEAAPVEDAAADPETETEVVSVVAEPEETAAAEGAEPETLESSAA